MADAGARCEIDSERRRRGHAYHAVGNASVLACPPFTADGTGDVDAIHA